MKVSWDWLKQYVRLDMSVEALVDRLMMSGLNHESTDEVGGDIVVDLEVTSNRPDCLGHLGIAREVAVLFGKPLESPATDFPEAGPPIESLTSVVVEPEARGWCPQYRARVIENVTIGPSPDWMQRRLRSLGLHPINNVVDVTNYVLLECGQPLHAFDLDKLIEQRIVVRNARDKEPFTAIAGDRGYVLTPSMGVIADGKRAAALAGVMGGADSEVGSTTRRILLETAEFTPLEIRRTSRALDLSSESSYRFERKIDPAGVVWASDRACHLLCQLAGGRVAKGAIHVGSSDYSRAPIRLRWSRVPRILGIEIPRETSTQILAGLGMTVESDGADAALATPPSFRRDMTREIDVVEEIGRVHGYDAVPEDRVIPMIVARQRPFDRVSRKLRDLLCAMGYYEAVTFSFTDAKHLELIRPWTQSAPLCVSHSSRRQENALRQSLLPSLLQCLSTNEARGNAGAALFEMAHLYLPSAGGGLPAEPSALGIVSSADVRIVRGSVERLLAGLRIQTEFRPCDVEGFQSGQCGEYLLGGKRIGVLGVLAEKARETLELRDPAVMAELLVDPLVAAAHPATTISPIPEHPSVVRDLAVVLDEEVRWAAVEELVRASAGECLEEMEFVDVYRGKQVPEGKKSMAFRLTYRAPGRTLTREEVDVWQQRVIDALARKLGGQLRA